MTLLREIYTRKKPFADIATLYLILLQVSANK